MNASLNSRPVPSPLNSFNEWRKSVTQAAIAAIIAGVEAAVAALPFKSFPWNDKDDDRNEKAFGLHSLQHTLAWLNSDPRDLDKMRNRLDWLENAPGKLQAMEDKYNSLYKSALTFSALAGKNLIQAMVFGRKAYKGFDPLVIADLDTKVEAAKEEAKAAVNKARISFESDVNNALFCDKIKGLRAALDRIDNISVEIECLNKEGATLSAKRKLAVEIEAIIAGRQTELDAAKAAREEAASEQAAVNVVNAEIDAEVEALIASSPIRKSRTTVKAPAVARNEIKASLDSLKDALVQKDSRGWTERKITKAQAIEIAGNKELLNAATDNALAAGEEEVLPASANRQAALLVRKSGAVTRFFVKEPVSAPAGWDKVEA